MCLIALAWQAHPAYRLVIAANRDEFHDRPASALDWWPDRPRIAAGRDLKAGGTWLAAAANGRFATVTNYRETLKAQTGERSRGELVTGFVTGSDTPLQFSQEIDGDRFAGFSLLTATPGALAYVSNRGDAARLLQPGVFGLSNAALDTPWPKVVRSKARLSALLDQEDLSVSALFELLSDRKATAGDAPEDGLPAALSRAVSAPFVLTPTYGTRCSTVLLLATDGTVRIEERRFAADGEPAGVAKIEFRIR